MTEHKPRPYEPLLPRFMKAIDLLFQAAAALERLRTQVAGVDAAAGEPRPTQCLAGSDIEAYRRLQRGLSLEEPYPGRRCIICGEGPCPWRDIVFDLFGGPVAGRARAAADEPGEQAQAGRSLAGEAWGLVGKSEGVAGLHLNDELGRFERLPSLARFGGGEPAADAERLAWLEAMSTLHQQVEILYVVDGYKVALTRDGCAQVGAEFHGKTLAEAIDAAMAHHPIGKAREQGPVAGRDDRGLEP